MADVKTETKPAAPVKTETKPAAPVKTENPRIAIREARMARLRVIDGPPKTIKVFAANERMRQLLRHSSGKRFRATLGEGVEWPNDSFTKRRIKDGSVRTDGPGSGEMPEPDGSLNPRQQAEVLTAVRDAASQLRLTSLSPNTAVSGSPDVVMTCNGSGFTPDTVIQFGEHDEPTTFVSETKVTTGVKPSLFAPAAVPVLVKNGTVSSQPLDFTFTAAEPGKTSPPAKHG